MKKISVLTKAAIGLVGLFLFLILSQCTKDGVIAKQLDRSTTADTTEFSAFYDMTKIYPSDIVADFNDSIVKKGVQSIIKEYCGISTCHGGPVDPKLATYNDIKNLVVPGDPEASKLWNLLTTSDLNKAMPPVNVNHEMIPLDKSIIYNWIKTGANEQPGLENFRPAAIRAITSGCTSGNCHNLATSTGAWARKGLIPGLVSSDTTTFLLVRSSGTTSYCQLSNTTLRNKVWGEYKDSVTKFYTDTLANASFRPYKTFSTPVVLSSVRGPLSSYDEILLDIKYPKSRRSSGSVTYTSNGKNFYVFGNYLNATSSLVSRIDSTLLLANPFTGVFATSHQGDMAYSDGGLTRNDIAVVKAWYFADPNIPDVWKYGNGNAGIYKYRKTSNIIKK
jgi:hypothetical protein